MVVNMSLEKKCNEILEEASEARLDIIKHTFNHI